MSVRIIEAPDPLVDLATVKQHLNVFHSDDDALIEGYIAAACAHIDGPMSWIGRAVGVQTLEAVFPSFCGLRLPLPPIIEPVSLKYLDENKVEQTVAPADYTIGNNRIWFRPGFGLPTLYSAHDAVRVQYKAGYPEVPPALKVAVLTHVGALYRDREASGDSKVVLPLSYEALASTFQVWHI